MAELYLNNFSQSTSWYGNKNFYRFCKTEWGTRYDGVVSSFIDSIIGQTTAKSNKIIFNKTSLFIIIINTLKYTW